MIQLGAVTYNIFQNASLEEIIKVLEAAGLTAVELRTEHKHGVEPSLGPAERAAVRKRFEASKVRLLSFGTTCEFHSPDPAVRKKNVEIGKQFVDLAHDTGAWGVKVRPNGLAAGVDAIGTSLRELGEYGAGRGVEIWLEVHGRETQVPTVAAAIMKSCGHPNVGLCWNSNPTDVINGSVKQNFELLRPWIKNAHINDLTNGYPYRELFHLLQASGYNRYALCEYGAGSCEPETFLRYYRALFSELCH